MHTKYVSVRLGVLALLDEGPSHGYQLKADFEARTGDVWTVNVGQIYTVLERLEKDGLVTPYEVESAGDRRPWRITPAGKQVVADWFDEASVADAPPRDELLVKVLLAMGRSRVQALGVIDTQRTAVYRLIQIEHAARRADADRPMPERVMAEALQTRREADLAWLDRCEQLLTAASGTASSAATTAPPREERP